MDSTLIIRLAGGLGNQLFQFCAAQCLVKRLGLVSSKVIIDTRFLSHYESKHKYEIGFFTKLFPNVQVAPRLPAMVSMSSRLRLARILDRRIGSFELISSVAHLNSSILSNNKASTYILDGYFQNPILLLEDKERFDIYTALYLENRVVIEKLNNRMPSIGLHIRRGDYVKSKSASKVFLNIPLSYYYSALKMLNNKKNIFVFSDDSDLSAFFAASIGGIDVRQFNLSIEDEFTLLMSCDDYIIANSTFSWWAAYLGHKPGGRVICPRNWYHNIDRSKKNPLLLSHFELIDA